MASCRGIGALALSIALLTSVPAFAEDESAEDRVVAPTKELTIVSWGGSYTRSQMLAYVKPYRLLSAEWVSMETYNGGLQQIREQVETENVIWDVVDFELSDLIRGCREGLLETIDHGTLPPGGDGTRSPRTISSPAHSPHAGSGRPCGRQWWPMMRKRLASALPQALPTSSTWTSSPANAVCGAIHVSSSNGP